MPTCVDEDAVLSVLWLFSRVDILELYDIAFEEETLDDPEPLDLLPLAIQPHTLCLRSVRSIACALELLHNSHALSNVRSLRLRSIESHSDAEAISRVIADTCKNLVHLDIDASYTALGGCEQFVVLVGFLC